MVATPTTPTAPEPVLHLFSGSSLAGWMPAFGSGWNRYHELPRTQSATRAAEAVVDAVRSSPARIVLHADHRSLDRDAEVGRLLAAWGHDIVGPSALASAVGRDKVLMQSVLRRAGVPQPSDRRAPDPAGPAEVVLKLRNGTEGIGARLGSASDLTELEVSERYVQGTEYSVNVFLSENAEVTFPPVAKGPTCSDLVPPPRRLRQCPAPGLSEATDRTLRTVAVAAARACDASGFSEVEFVIEDSTGDVLVLEINPRVSGTLRMSAMATGTTLLDLYSAPTRGSVSLEAHRTVLELPYSGEPFCHVDQGMVATSRATVAGADYAEARARLDRLVGQPDG